MRGLGIRLPFLKRRDHSGRRNGGGGNGGGRGPGGPSLSRQLQANLNAIRRELGDSSDLTIRLIRDDSGRVLAAVVYIDGIVIFDTINQMLLSPIMERVHELSSGRSSLSAADMRALLEAGTIQLGRVRETYDLSHLIEELLTGSTIILSDGSSVAFAAATRGGEKRSVDEPSSQTVARGPKEGFTEDVQTNISLIRRRIKSPLIRVENRLLGKHTKTVTSVVYMKGIAREEVVEEIRRRLSRIEVDSILESGYVEEFIQDEVWTPFPTIQNSERPDAIAAGILEGQVAIVVDGSPFVLLAPVTFVKFFQSSEDYYQRFDIATFLRVIRMVSFFISMLLPSLYIAITTFHQEMLPTPLLISLAAQREGVPFPALIEAMLMEVTFEVLREAGVRMPRIIGPAISIVGALVLGQAAVQAGLVSAAMIIVVSFTAIANFVIPALNMAIAARLIRFAMMLLAATLGLFGIMSGVMILLIHLVSLKSFGVPYMTPLAPLKISNLKDVLVRAPWWLMKTRPSVISTEDRVRQAPGLKPGPPKDRGERGS
ncbi:spore germination protein [Cohnella lubricantis]|uniref:Spore germination protein n=1 Tax=Cohnella lubricantis TaxID=2163172 RepID=A0A841THA7_9BACL|nr:spore germination protein [Cohnella lubricantis]MBB6678630.1 spore germination protein [Cohnella lubricantis]MBP2119210.1 spore germination protein KA [Cohnella lubricantis]